MKKIIAMLLALVMVCGLATTAFADGELINTADWTTPEDPENEGFGETLDLVLNKLYTVTGNTYPVEKDAYILPDETLSFVSTAVEGNPDMNKNLTIASLDDGDMDKSAENVMAGTMAITLPIYDKVGVYNYNITETAGAAQGAEYNVNNATIGIQVMVTYDYDNEALKTEVVLTVAGTDDDDSLKYEVSTGEGTETKWKLDTFENTYDVGHLEVKKIVEGNMADESVEFQMLVSFQSEKQVMSDITIVDDTNNNDEIDETVTSIAKNWTKNEETGKYEASATIYVRGDETVKFYNIPDGVTYTVEENSKHTDKTDLTLNSSENYQFYDVEYDYENDEKAISSDTTDKVNVTNTKEDNVDTGIALDSAPYFLMLAVAVVGMVALVSKKRYEV